MKLMKIIVLGFLAVSMIILFAGLIGISGLNKVANTASLVDASMEVKLSLRTNMQMISELILARDIIELNGRFEESTATSQDFEIYSDAILYGGDTAEGYISKTDSENLKNIIERISLIHNNEVKPSIIEIYNLKKKSFQAHKDIEKNDIDADIFDKSYALKTILERLITDMGVVEEDVKIDMKKDKAFASSVLIASIVIGIILAILIGVIISLIITRPIHKMISIAKKISEGDLRVEVDEKLLKSDNEIGNLANSFDTMIMNLRGLVESITKYTDNTEKTSKILLTGSETVNFSMKQVGATVTEISRGAKELTKSLVDTQSRGEQLISSVEMVSDISQNSAINAKKAYDKATEGGKSAEIAEEKMKEIKSSISSSATIIQELGNKTEEINKIVEVINSISEQTNLLALNAAIEAARAGDAGRGFAVVADEVRKLAEESQKATKQIAIMIHEIIESTSAAVESMNKGTNELEKGSKVVNQALNSLKDIGNIISETSAETEEICAASNIQTVNAKAVKDAIDTVAALAEEDATGSEAVKGSIEEALVSMNKVTETSKELAKNAYDLKYLVEVFITKKKDEEEPK